MTYVLDSSVALKWVLAEAESGIALRLRDDYNKGVHALIAPDLFTPEVANALVAAERQARIKKGEAMLLLHDVVRSAPAIRPTFSLLVRAMEIAITARQAVYDCVYVALAEAEGCEFVTADDRLVRSLRPTFPLMVDLKNLP
jgi:predicted nucleic acid-binding protein